MCYFTYYGTFKYSIMETKNSKRVLLTDEELMVVVGGFVQLINPSSGGNYDPTEYGCENAKTKNECVKLSDDNGGHCRWESKQCQFNY